MIEELPEITRKIYHAPQNPGYLTSRATIWSRLGFADLAAGDAYKASQLLDIGLRDLFGESRSNYEDVSDIPLKLKAAAVRETGFQKTTLLWLGSILIDTQDRKTAQVINREARIKYPSDPDLEKREHFLITVLEEHEKQAQLRKATSDTRYFSDDSRLGRVFHLAYPFIPRIFLGRSAKLIQSTNKEIENESKKVFSSCSLRSSIVQDPMESTSSGAPTALGIFANLDIPEGFPFLIDTTILAATEDRSHTCNAIEICDNCCGTIPSDSTQKRLANCCTVLYCSTECKDLAWKNYHQVLCKQDFGWVWDDSKTGEPRYDLDGPMWLRILAVCVQKKSHPLEHPLIARLTPLYDEHTYRRWSLSNNITMPIRILQQLGIDIYADSRFDTWVLQTLWIRNITNVHQNGDLKVSGFYFLMTLRCLCTRFATML